MKTLIISASSQLGCVRQNNEDMILIDETLIRNDIFNIIVDDSKRDRLIIALADGMGGHNAGEVASEMVLSNLRFFIGDLPQSLYGIGVQEIVFNWLESINKIIASKGLEDSSLSSMGTTLIAILYYGGRYYWMNCGDSRLYRMHEGELYQLSIDHSLNTLVGEKKHSNVLTNCIGAGCKTSYFDIMDFTDNISKGDVFVLCSDGLNDMLDDDEIKSIIESGGDADMLCNAAINAGGFDNVSVCLIKIE